MNQRPQRAGSLPAGLEIHITNRCNLTRGYCSNSAAAAEDIRTLTFKEAARAIDLYASHVRPDPRMQAGDPVLRRTIGLAGGEPFLEFELLKDVVGHIRGKWPWLGIEIVTNGTLLTPGKVDFLAERGVELAINLDGSRSDAVMDHLGRLSRKQIENICVLATFSSETIDALIERMTFLRQFSFKKCIFELDMYELWPAKRLPALRRVLRDLRRSYERELRHGGVKWPQPSRMYGLTFENKLGAAGNFPPVASMSLSSDGFFFPCGMSDFKSAQKHSVGSIREGIDLHKLKGGYSFLSGYLRQNDYVDAVLPPVERYFHALSNGISPRKLLENGREVAGMFKEELGVFIPIEKILMKLARERSFGDFNRRPKRPCRKEIRTLGLRLGPAPGRAIAKDPAIVKARESIDLLLHSPGVRKELVVLARGISRGTELLRPIAVYAVLKAKSLQKSLKISIEGDAWDLGEGELGLMKEYGVFLGGRNSKKRPMREDA